MNNFIYVGNRYGKQCAFCKSTASVKYIVTLDSKYPVQSIVTPAKVYACNKCVVEVKANEALD